MVEAVLRLGEVLADEAVRQMAVDADATPWWLAFCQESYCGCMMWQFTHTFGSSLMYDKPSA